jgi:peptidyl-tRNA hydrolase, PTH1 family
MPKQILIGLGNPGEEYENTYHNVGAIALTAMRKALEPDATPFEAYKKIFEYSTGTHHIFIRPLTFMNESGKAVREAIKHFKVKPKDLVVLHDESDLIVGDFKISFNRSAAGHKGVQSVIDAVGTPEFYRIRIGIRPAKEKHRQKAGEFALKQITPKDKLALKKAIEAALNAQQMSS